MKKLLFASMLFAGALFTMQSTATTSTSGLAGKIKVYEPCYNPRVFYFCEPGTGTCSPINCYFWP